MKKDKKEDIPLPPIVRLRVDDEEFDAQSQGDGTYRVAEVVLSDLCTHGDVVRADETGRVVSVVEGGYGTFVTFCDSEAEARLVAKSTAGCRASRVLLGAIVLSAVRHDLMDFQAEPRKGRMRCPYRDGWKVVRLPFGAYVLMAPLDAVRTERYAMWRFQDDRRLVDGVRLGNAWPLWIVQEMLAATLTDESALPIALLDP